jgi:hypothetical protein
LICVENTEFGAKISSSAEEVFLVPTSDAALKIGDVVEVLNEATSTWNISKITDTGSSKGYWDCVDGVSHPGKLVRHPLVPDLAHLKTEIQMNRGEELAIFPSYQVFTSLVRRNVQKWEVMMNDLADFYVKEVQSLCRNAATSLNLPKSLASLLRMTALRCITDLRRDAIVLLGQELDKELHPFTLNHYLYDILIKSVFRAPINSR